MEQKLKKILFITNIPAPYRVDFYNELGKLCQLTVIFESNRASVKVKYNWNDDQITNFTPIYLTTKSFNAKKIKWNIFKYLSASFDVIVVTNYAYITETLTMLYLKVRRIPFFYETDGGIVKYDESIGRKWFKKVMLSQAVGYFSPSKSSDEYLRYYTPSSSEMYRYHFTSLLEKDIVGKLPSFEREIVRQKIGVKEKKVILGIGRFIPRKGFDILIKAFQQLSDPDVGLYIIGGEPTVEYKHLASGFSNIHFEGFMSKDMLKHYMLIADLFIHPTREDIWGLVINEAMSCGLPIITTSKCVAGLELLPNECIIPVGDVNALVYKMKQLIGDESLLNKLSDLNLSKIKDYTIQQMVEDHLKIFTLYTK